MAEKEERNLEARKHHVARQQLVTYLLRVPYWTFYALPKASRPHPQWSVERVVRRKIMKTDSRIAGLSVSFLLYPLVVYRLLTCFVGRV